MENVFTRFDLPPFMKSLGDLMRESMYTGHDGQFPYAATTELSREEFENILYKYFPHTAIQDFTSDTLFEALKELVITNLCASKEESIGDVEFLQKELFAWFKAYHNNDTFIFRRPHVIEHTLSYLEATGCVPSDTLCPFREKCELAEGCFKGGNPKRSRHGVTFSCAVARGFLITDTVPNSIGTRSFKEV